MRLPSRYGESGVAVIRVLLDRESERHLVDVAAPDRFVQVPTAVVLAKVTFQYQKTLVVGDQLQSTCFRLRAITMALLL